jgi:hypothetical protein
LTLSGHGEGRNSGAGTPTNCQLQPRERIIEKTEAAASISMLLRLRT